ncbi:beta-ketoacyl synthase N-terminal-like domain-containing protein [Streptomyces sp. BF23-19]|uniref:beta-ketoacyl synthase N-terminal-like domain-containing protein n=1 Tax=unclassified Streptomyces TaxID=2593676 RepID=UPI0034E4B20F
MNETTGSVHGSAGEAVAVVGMAGRFPGAAGTQEFWRGLVDGVESVRAFSDTELARAGVSPQGIASPTRVPRGADLADADLFDAGFFGVTQRDARLMDPQHRVFLTCAWQALEDAGLAPHAAGGPVGVFASTSLSTYLLANVLRSSEYADAALSYPVLLGNDKDFLATRVSYKLDLRGPSMSVQSACSSSLTAVHLACRALARGEVRAALAGGVSITFPQTSGYEYQEGGILSRDGHCRVFDAGSAGTVKGNGCGVVVLKRLADALADGDRIYAVVRGTAVNNDGSDKIGFTAPGPQGQQAVIRAALQASGIPASDIGYIETHGTGTAVGDPLELHALSAAYRAAGGPAPDCLIGSVKANVGHLDAAAGVTGLIKAALALYHQTVPRQINYSTPNPQLRLDRQPFDVPTESLPYPRATPLRAAAVSSFGLGGTNAHAVLEAPPAPTVPAATTATTGGGREVRYPVVLSARDTAALAETARALRVLVDGATPPAVRDIAYTLSTGRALLPVRHVFEAATLAELRAGLDAAAAGELSVAAPPDGGWAHGPALKVALPGHPLRPERHWIEPDTPTATDAAPPAPSPSVSPTVTVTVAVASVVGGEVEDGVLEGVLKVLEEGLGIDAIAPDDDFYDLGGDSLLAVELVTALRTLFGIDLDLDEFARLRTPDAMADHVRAARAGTGAAGGGVRAVRDGRGTPVYLVPPAGGTNFLYHRLADRTPAGPALRALSFPSEEAGRPGTLRELAALYVGRIREEQPAGPYRLGGYSFGGNVAFEMAVQLQRAGEEVEQLIMLDTHVPETYVGGHLDAEGFEAAFPVLFEAAAVRGVDPGLLREQGFLEVWQHNHALLKGYYPDRPFAGDVTLLQAEEPEGDALLDALRMNPRDKSVWGAHITGRLLVDKVPGDHFSMFDEGDRIARLGAAFGAALAPHDPEGDPRC